MKKIAMLFSVLSILAAVLVSAESDKDKKNLPKKGSLSTSYTGAGTGNADVNMPWGETVGDSSLPPVAGSVSKINSSKSVAKLFNNSSDTYSVDVEVVQYDNNGKKIRSDYFAYILKPNSNVERIIPTQERVSYSELILNDWKKLTPPTDRVESTAVSEIKNNDDVDQLLNSIMNN